MTANKTLLTARDLNVLIVSSDTDVTDKLKQVLRIGGVRNIDTLAAGNGSLKKVNESLHDLLFISAGEFNRIYGRLINGPGKRTPDTFTVVVDDSTTLERSGLEFGSVTYLSLPIEYVKLESIISNFLLIRKLGSIEKNISRINAEIIPQKLKFSTRAGHVFIHPGEIIYLKADSNYTHVHLRDRKNITVSKSLRTFDEGLGNNSFVRISRSAIINTEYLKSVDRANRHCLLEVNGQQFKLSLTGSYARALMDNYLSC